MQYTGYGVMFTAYPCPAGMSLHSESHIYMSIYELDCVEMIEMIIC